ncbi:hypothetical protein BMS3Abin15_00717 [bacterium BMS3Abin15]|nr:hypothetical protein BMS3Abin15_00717 [bacterium BMS3Abin15]HDZ85938.1 hypothetical protein [Candidatus Moranbacteria bacterium]
MNKIFLFIVIALLAIALFLTGIVVFSVFEYDEKDDSVTVNLNEEDESALKEFAGKIKKWIYREATIHNPEGDVLPDELDDKIIKELKEKIN